MSGETCPQCRDDVDADGVCRVCNGDLKRPAPPAAEPDAVVLHRDDAAWMQQLFENASKMSGLPSLADRAHYMNAAAKLRHLLRASGGVTVDDGDAVTHDDAMMLAKDVPVTDDEWCTMKVTITIGCNGETIQAFRRKADLNQWTKGELRRLCSALGIALLPAPADVKGGE